jgi:enterochelin esterase family protein
MKTKTLLATMFAAVFCAQMAAQPFQRESFPEGSYSPVTNINRNGYPRVLKDGSVMFRVQAPQAQQVQIDLCGTKYDMTKGEGGTWMVTTKQQVPGFHYYSLVVDGVPTADPASQSFFGCGRWSSAIEIKEVGCDDFEVQDVAQVAA